MAKEISTYAKIIMVCIFGKYWKIGLYLVCIFGKSGLYLVCNTDLFLLQTTVSSLGLHHALLVHYCANYSRNVLLVLVWEMSHLFSIGFASCNLSKFFLEQNIPLSCGIQIHKLHIYVEILFGLTDFGVIGLTNFAG